MRVICFLFFLCCFLGSCRHDDTPVPSPPGYNLKDPTKFVMDEELTEISGITFLPGRDDSLYSIQDEDGKVFYFKVGEKRPQQSKFAKRGDFEDIAVAGGQMFAVLRSDGTLFSFSSGDLVNDDKVRNVSESRNVLPEGEYEGLCGTGTSVLYALCKNCKGDDQKEEVSVYALNLGVDGQFKLGEQIIIDVSHINLPKEKRRGRFRPSALAIHPITHERYILSSVNKVLLVLDEQWKLKASYALRPSVFKQPEGLTFDSKGNMYISNEGDDGNGNVLLFKYNTSR